MAKVDLDGEAVSSTNALSATANARSSEKFNGLSSRKANDKFDEVVESLKYGDQNRDDRSSTKRMLAPDSSPVKTSTTGTSILPGDSMDVIMQDGSRTLEMNRRSIADTDSTDAHRKEPTSGRPDADTSDGAGTIVRDATMIGYGILHSRKRVRTGRDNLLDQDSLPPSSTHSGVTSPIDSDASCGDVMTSPTLDVEDDVRIQSGSLLRDHLSTLKVESGANSSASSSHGSVTPSVPTTLFTTTVGSLVASITQARKAKIETIAIPSSPDSPRPPPSRLIRGRPAPYIPIQSSPTAVFLSPQELPLYPDDDKFNEFFFHKMKGVQYSQMDAHKAWTLANCNAQEAMFALATTKHLKSATGAASVEQQQQPGPSARQLGNAPYCPSTASTSPSSARVKEYQYKPSVTLRNPIRKISISDDRPDPNPFQRPPQSVVNSPAPRRVTLLPQKSSSKEQRRHVSSGSEDEEYDEGSGDEYSTMTKAQIAERERAALVFFNECSRESMMDLASCNASQATLVIKLRPFESSNDFWDRTRKQKGVGNNLFENYLSIVAGMADVDSLLTNCEDIGVELAQIMSIWTGVDNNSNAGVDNLVHASTSNEEAQASTDPKVRAAFKGFLTKQPELMSSKIQLKDYQMLGLNWLVLLHSRKTSCILADEMGLGKTAQVIALLAHVKATGGKGPHLVIVPSSTLENWLREFSVFAPSLVVRSYYGSQADRHDQRGTLRRMDNLDVVVTTYNMATSTHDDAKFVKKLMKFQICVFDEGHQLKNSESKKYKDLMGIRAEWRLLLTGTPLQNNLQELISLLSFILPEQFLDAGRSLRAIFKPGASSAVNLLSRERIARAKKMMTPFVLRRKKAQVLKDLPNKFERIEWCEMTSLQRAVHDEAMVRSKKALLDAGTDLDALAADEDEGEAKSKKASSSKVIKVKVSGSNVLMDLRKASNHPMLFRRLYPDKVLRAMSKDCLKEDEFEDRDKNLIFEDMQVMTDFELHRLCMMYKHIKKYALVNEEWMSAAKVAVLQRLLPEMKARGDRILLFSQFTQVLDILEMVLNTMNIKWIKLTGQTNVADRQGLVDDFNEDDEITVFLLSTRAGGLGLNLTAANTVIIHDQDFNPHADKQAEDRAYRIGQLRDVTVIRLICKDSVEEMMRSLATAKLKLDTEVSGTSHDQQQLDDNNDEDSAQIEKKMKSSILRDLKKRFDDESDVTQATVGATRSSPRKAKVDAGASEMKAAC